MNKHRVIGVIVLVAVAVIVIQFIITKQQQIEPDFHYQHQPPPPQPVIEQITLTAPVQPESAVSTVAEPVEVTQSANLVVVPPPTDTVNAYVLQLASFSQEQTSQNLVGKLQQLGFDSFIFPFNYKGTMMYRVYVGPVVSKEDVDAIKDSVALKTGQKGIVQHYSAHDI